MTKTMKTRVASIGAVACTAALVAGLGLFASGQEALGAEGAAESAPTNPYVGVTDTIHGDEAMAEGLIQAGTTFSDLKNADVAVLLDEGGKLMFDPHAGHYDFKCADCHRGAADDADDDAAPVLMCNTCHQITLPDGWENPAYNQSTKPKYVDPLTIYGNLGYGTTGVSYGIPYGEDA